MTIIKPKYQPRYPEYKWRCRMRCWDIWRCWGPIKKWKELLSYEQIIALSSDDAVTELNSAAVEYYDKFRREWHLLGDCLSDDGTAIRKRNEPWHFGLLPYIAYSNWTWGKRYPDI